ncbi:MAG: aminodeoxychorismate synthase component I [Candidatus Omnitrophica bacterium]|nr:aminodeoxychorismate synthase component I [Candidatus Omnitrophota bacterium]
MQENRSPFEVFLNETSGDHRVLLESLSPGPPASRYSYICWDPEAVFDSRTVSGNPFDALERFFNDHRKKSKIQNPKSGIFSGGIVGCIGYEAARFLEKLPRAKRDPEFEKIPDLYFFVPRKILVIEHKAKNASSTKEESLHGNDKNMNGKIAISNLKSSLTRRQFERMVRRAQEYIRAGDIYQANVSQRFSFRYSGSPLGLYRRLRQINPAPFSAYLQLGDMEIASSSPEMLIRQRNRSCQTRPIAGTRPRGATGREDKRLTRELMLNEKEKAEHLMLLDLERNDLGRVCDFHTVRVNEYMTLEQYSHVSHIVSNVRGRLQEGKNSFDLLRALFPGGTITGCPKIRSMEIIHELEPVRRGMYTGSIGYIGFNEVMDMNIVIRTILCRKGRGWIQAGAGIVHDSVPLREYEEMLHKAQAMFEALA